MIEKRVIRHKNRRFESKELPSQTALRLRSDKNKRLVPDEEDNVFAAVSQMCSEPVLAHDRDETQAVVRESLDEKVMESPQLVLRSDRNKALIPDGDDTQVSVAAGEKMLLKALNSPRINWRDGEMPVEPDMPDSVEEEETAVLNSQIRPQIGRASVDLLESEYAFTQSFPAALSCAASIFFARKTCASTVFWGLPQSRAASAAVCCSSSMRRQGVL